MAQHRTAFQLLKEANNRIAKLKERVARDVVAEHDDIKIFDTRLKSIQGELTKARRYTNEDNGLASRIVKLKEAIADATVKLANASQIQADLESEIQELKAERSLRVKEILEESDLDIDSIMAEAEANG
jgi:F0F1-type ATP synthase membrane subunit b/b'